MDILEQPIVVATPIVESIIVRNVHKDSVVKIGDQELLANLIPLKILEFDAILGLDWLASHLDSVDFFKRGSLQHS